MFCIKEMALAVYLTPLIRIYMSMEVTRLGSAGFPLPPPTSQNWLLKHLSSPVPPLLPPLAFFAVLPAVVSPPLPLPAASSPPVLVACSPPVCNFPNMQCYYVAVLDLHPIGLWYWHWISPQVYYYRKWWKVQQCSGCLWFISTVDRLPPAWWGMKEREEATHLCFVCCQWCLIGNFLFS